MDNSIRWRSSLAIVLLFSAACEFGIADPTPAPSATPSAEVEPDSTAATPQATAIAALSPTPPVGTTPAPRLTPVPLRRAPVSSAIPTQQPPTATPTHTPSPTQVPAPTASFDFDVSDGSAPVIVQFSDTSVGRVTSWQWDFGDGLSSKEQHPSHEYTLAGSSTVRLTVAGPGGTDVAVLPEAIAVKPGPLAEVAVSPSQITVEVQGTVSLSARALDKFENEITEVAFRWSALATTGRIDEAGLFAAGTVAGTHEGLVKMTATQGTLSQEASIDVTITPGPLSTVAVEPTEVSLNIGGTQTFTFSAYDEFGNQISDVLSSWSAQPAAGVIDATGLFSAGTKPGVYPSAIGVEVVKGTARAQATSDVSVPPGPLAAVEVDPSFSVVERQATQQFTAAAFDQHGNEIPEVALLWESTGGAITQGGLFTAGGQSGAYEVRVAATFKDNARSGSATIPIPPVWLPVGNMLLERTQHRAILLADGKVLVVGDNPAEIYDPITRTFSIAENSRCNHGGGLSATLLGDGTVLIAGGANNPRCAEVYDSEAGVFSRVGDLNVDHNHHTATLLLDGRVLIAGGSEDLPRVSITHAVAEIYDPVTEAFSLTPNPPKDVLGDSP